jgi:hypothetical protein
MSIIEKYRECDTSFKKREEVLAELRRNDAHVAISIIVAFLFAALGVIGDALKITLGLESRSWFLLAIFAGLFTLLPKIHEIEAKHLLGIVDKDLLRKESVSKGE